MQFLLSVAIFFCLLHSNTRADNDDIITDEDLKAFEEALAAIRNQGSSFSSSSSSSLVSAQDLTRRLSGRSKKLNARLLTTTLSPLRKRQKTRSHLRRFGIFRKRANKTPPPPTNPPTSTTVSSSPPLIRRLFNFRKTRRKPVQVGSKRRRISGDTKKRNNVLTRLLLKAENEKHRGGSFIDEQADIEKSIFLALRELTTPPTLRSATTVAPPSGGGFSLLKATTEPPRHRGEIVRKTTVTGPETTTEAATEGTSTVPALEALIAALENIEPKEFAETELEVEDPTTTSEATTTTTTTARPGTRRRTTALSSTTTATTPETRSRSRARGFSHRQEQDSETPGPVPPPPSFEEEAQKLSIDIEKNFIDEEGLEPLELGPEPPSPPPGPPAPPHLGSAFAPPGAEPPSDQVVEELNEAEDFLEVARRLQLRRRQSRL